MTRPSPRLWSDAIACAVADAPPPSLGRMLAEFLAVVAFSAAVIAWACLLGG